MISVKIIDLCTFYGNIEFLQPGVKMYMNSNSILVLFFGGSLDEKYIKHEISRSLAIFTNYRIFRYLSQNIVKPMAF